jgi:16S rRNA U1498 N3-methylase RsmE
MLERAVLTCFDEQDQEWQTRIENIKEKAAQNLLKAKVAPDIVAQSLVLPIAEIEKLTKTQASSTSNK